MRQLADVPKISQDLSKAVKDLRNYIIDLNAWLKYKLNNLEVENFTEASQNEIRVTQNGSPADSATYEYVIKHIADAVSRATELITGHQGGYVVLNPSEKPSEILIMDTDNIDTATKVWRWNGAGLGYSSTGYDGTYGLAMTMDGAINADFITAGKITSIELVSSTITGGTININDNFKVDSDGNVEIAGAISWGSENSPVKVQYSIDGSTMWHDTFTAGDTFAKYSYDGGTTYTSAVKIVGTDASVPEYIKSTHIDMTSVTSPYVIAGSLQGSNFVHYPPAPDSPLSYSGTAIKSDSNWGSNIFAKGTGELTGLAVGSVVNVGSSVYGMNYAYRATILNFRLADGTIVSYPTQICNLDIAYVGMVPNVANAYISLANQTTLGEPFTLYNVPITNHTDLSGYASNKLGGIKYTAGFFTLFTENDTTMKIQSDSILEIESDSIIMRQISNNAIIFQWGNQLYSMTQAANVGGSAVFTRLA